MSIFRETFHKNIRASLNHRQDAMVESNRTVDNIQYLNSRNSWIKMQSSVNVNGKADLAKAYVLQGGTLNGNKLKSGIGSDFSTDAYSNMSAQQDVSGKFIPYRLGIRPMPGITSIDVKSKSAYGSLREVIVNFQCWDIHQLEDLELLYMRPGYTVLIEWGWTPYLDVNGKYQPNYTDFYDILNKSTTERSSIFKALYKASTDSGGNYDAMFGYIKNYQWSAREDGGYDCQTTVISTGEIIESLKINYLKADLAKYDLYKTGITGKGLLDELFSKQGNNKSSDFAAYYEKNVLAGTWAELSLKQRDPNAEYKSTAGIHFAHLKMPGLKGNGDSTSMVLPGSDYQEYITLESAFKILNQYIIGKDSSGEPLITLSTRHNKYDSSSVMGNNLLCIAHPLQISTDPSICIIKNPLWDSLMNDVVVSTTPTLNAIQTEADAIVKALIDASEDAGSVVMKLNDFDAAIKRIKTSALYTTVNDVFIKGKYNDGTDINAGRTDNWKFSTNGLAGLIQEQFIEKIGSNLGNAFTVSSLSSIWLGNDTNEVRVLKYLNSLRQHFTPIGVDLDFSLPINSGVTAVSNTSLKTLNKADLTTVTPSIIVAVTTSSDDGSGGFIDVISNELSDYNFKAGQVTITSATSTAAAATSIIFSAADAKAMISEINKGCTEDYFTSQYSEIGILSNIYVNLDFLYKLSTSGQMESQDSKEKNEINVYSYVKNIISGINSSLGSVANLEVHVDPIDSIGRVIDVNYTDPDKTTKSSLFELQVQNYKSIVRSYSLQSKIFPNQSAIVAIGSQAEGGQLGMQNNTMVDFNKTLIDRIIPEKAKKETANGQDKNDPVVTNSLAGIITLYAICHQDSPKDGSAYSDAVSKCKNALRDVIAYFQSLFKSSGSNRNIIPTKLSFTMDGIGGLVIGQLFTINDDVLPKGYKGGINGIGSELAQTITGISHKVGNSDWTTTIDALNVILDKRSGSLAGKESVLKKIINNIIALAIARANAIQSIQNPINAGQNPFGLGACGDVTNRKNYPLLQYPEIPYQKTVIGKKDIIAYFKTQIGTYSKEVVRSTYASFGVESGYGRAGINNNLNGMQTDGGKWALADKYITGVVNFRENTTQKCRSFAAYATWQKCCDHVLYIMSTRIEGSKNMEIVPSASNKNSAAFWAQGYAKNWIGSNNPTGLEVYWNDAVREFP